MDPQSPLLPIFGSSRDYDGWLFAGLFSAVCGGLSVVAPPVGDAILGVAALSGWGVAGYFAWDRRAARSLPLKLSAVGTRVEVDGAVFVQLRGILGRGRRFVVEGVDARFEGSGQEPVTVEARFVPGGLCGAFLVQIADPGLPGRFVVKVEGREFGAQARGWSAETTLETRSIRGGRFKAPAVWTPQGLRLVVEGWDQIDPEPV